MKHSTKRIWQEGEDYPKIGIDFIETYDLADSIYNGRHTWNGPFIFKNVYAYRNYYILKYWRYATIAPNSYHEAVYLIANPKGEILRWEKLGPVVPDSFKDAKQIIDSKIEGNSP